MASSQRNWTEEEDAALRQSHGTMPLADLARGMGRTRCSLRSRVTKLGLNKQVYWTDDEIDLLRQAYSSASFNPDIGLAGLAERLGRDKANVCRKARTLGLTDISRKSVAAWKVRRKTADDEELRSMQSEAAKRRIAENGHPRGFAGGRHSDETKLIIAAKSRAYAKRVTVDQKAAAVLKQLQTKVERYGCIAPERPQASWKSGWREFGGKRNYYRSRWEANYARYLEWLKSQGQIKEWQHEPETFWFEAIKRGVRSYLPDFRVWENDGSSKLHEVKGWMCARSKTTLRRMAKYHPQETIIVIRERDYNSIARTVGRMIEGWESGGRADRP